MLADWVKQAVSTGGTGNLTLGSADSGFITLDTAVGQGPRFTYSIEDGANRETGIGYLSAATTLVRQYIRETLVSGTYDNTTPTAITVTTAAKVTISATAQNTFKSIPRHYGAATAGRRQFGHESFKLDSFSTRAIAANTIYVVPFLWRGGYPVATLYSEVTTGASGKLLRMAIADPGADWSTTAILCQTGGLSVTDGGMIAGSVTPIHLSPGWYVALLLSDGTPSMRTFNTYGESPLGWSSTTGYNKITQLTKAKTYGVFSATEDLTGSTALYGYDADGGLAHAFWAGE